MFAISVLAFITSLGLVDPSPIRSVCSHLPYDFHRLPGTNDYFFVKYESKNATEARNYCLSVGMDLPSILSSQQNDLFFGFLRRARVNEGLFHTAGQIQRNNTIKWVNGDNTNYTNFETTYSFDPIKFHIAINKTSGKWNLVSADTIAGVFCELRC